MMNQKMAAPNPEQQSGKFKFADIVFLMVRENLIR
jgi:hypothetical protein